MKFSAKFNALLALSFELEIHFCVRFPLTGDRVPQYLCVLKLRKLSLLLLLILSNELEKCNVLQHKLYTYV